MWESLKSIGKLLHSKEVKVDKKSIDEERCADCKETLTGENSENSFVFYKNKYYHESCFKSKKR